MTRANILDRLAAMPDLLTRALGAVAPAARRVRPPAGGFSLAEHAWHLADLEREGYGARITRILAEDRPSLADFDGDRAAREREYLRADVGLGVEVFAQARRRNVERLSALGAPELARPAVQDGVGDLVLSALPAMMAEHDRQHAAELAALLDALGAPAGVRDAVRAHAAGKPGPAARGSRAA